jgi:Zn-dependent protease
VAPPAGCVSSCRSGTVPAVDQTWISRYPVAGAVRTVGSITFAATAPARYLLVGVFLASWSFLFSLGAAPMRLVDVANARWGIDVALVVLIALFAVPAAAVRWVPWPLAVGASMALASLPSPQLGDVVSAAVVLAVAAGVVASLLLHEAAHVLAGRAVGLHADGVLITGFGAAAVFPGDRFPSPRAMTVTTVAGPALNAAVAAASFAAAAATGSTALAAFAWVNLATAALNALPLPPLDGGWALTGLVWRVRGGSHDDALNVSWKIGAALTGSVCVAALAASGAGAMPLWMTIPLVAIVALSVRATSTSLSRLNSTPAAEPVAVS